MSNDQRKPPKKKIIVVNDGVDNMTDDKSPADFQDAEKKTVIEVRSWTERPGYLLQDGTMIESYKEQLNKAWTKAINSLDEPENWQQSVFDISKIVNSIAEVIRNSPYGDIEEFFLEYDGLRPFVSEELKKHPDLKHLNADSFLGELEMYDVFGDDPDNELTQVLKAARREKARQDTIKRQRENQADYSKVTYKESDGISYPVDKWFSDFFKPQSEEDRGREDKELIPEKLSDTGIELRYENPAKKETRLQYDYFIEKGGLKKFGIEQPLPEP